MHISIDIQKYINTLYPNAVLLHNRNKSAIWDSKKNTILKLTNCPGAIDWLCTSYAKHKPYMPKVLYAAQIHKTAHTQVFLFEIEKLETFDDALPECGPAQLKCLSMYDGWLMRLSHQITQCNHQWTKPGKKMSDKLFFKKFNSILELPSKTYPFYKEIKIIRTILKKHKGNAYPDLTGPQDNIMFRKNGEMVILDPIASISPGMPLTPASQKIQETAVEAKHAVKFIRTAE